MEQAAHKRAEKAKNILLVEDEAIIALCEQKFLEQNGFCVCIANTGEAAVSQAAQNQRLDLILMDIDLGSGINGAEAARQILRRHDLPIVFLSSHTEPEVVESTEAISSYGYIVKNSGNTVLLASIKMALKLFQAHQREKRKQEKLQHYETILRHQAGLHKLLIDMATLYINLPGAEVETAINNSLRQIGEFTMADRVYIFDFDYARNLAVNTYEWCAAGVPAQIDRLQAMPLASIDEAMKLHRQGLPLHMDEVERLAPGPLKATLSEQGIQSILVVPMMENGRCIGSVGFDVVRQKHKFISEEIELLTVFTQLLVNVRQRKRNEEQLKLHSLVLDQIMDHVTITDLNGRILYVNKAEVDLFGIPANHLIGHSTDRYGEDPSYGATQRQILEETKNQGQYRTEVVNLAADGSRHIMDCRTREVLDDQGKAVALCGIATDITERKQIEQRLRYSEEKFSAIFHASQNLVSLSDLETGLFIEVNPAFCEKLGYRQEEVIGRKPAEIVRLERAYTEELRKRLIAGQIIRNEEAVLRTRDNKVLNVILSGSIIQVADRRYILAVAVDISGRRAMEQDLQRRMQEQDILLRETHHRIKNNIASIHSLLSIQANITSSAEAGQVLQEAMSRVDSMYSLYAHMVNTDEYQDMDAGLYLGELCDSVMELFSGKLGEAAVKLEKNFEPVRISSSRLSKIGIIVNELLTNALKYAFHRRAEGCISVSLRLDNASIELTVSDDGKGMESEKASGSGKGFGLTLVHMLCEQLDASLEQRNHCGTSFILRLAVDENKEKS